MDMFDKFCFFLESPKGSFIIGLIFAVLVVFAPPAVGGFVQYLVGGFFVCGLIAMVVPPIGFACFAFWLFGIVYLLTHPL